MYFLGLDIGSTCTKCQLFNENGDILYYEANECDLINVDGETYADIDKIIELTKQCIKNANKVNKIDSISVSSFGESFVLLDKDDNIIFKPMLYFDPRGEVEAQYVTDTIGNDVMYKEVGVVPQALYSIYKLLWIKNNRPEIYEKADKMLQMNEFIGYMLTKKRYVDYGMCSRTGVFDFKNKVFHKEIIEKIGLNYAHFSKPMPIGYVVGNITAEIANELGLKEDCKFVLGSQDQVCATIGAGAIYNGEAADGLGTVECITTIFDTPPTSIKLGEMGFPIVPFIEDRYCTYLLNYSSGSAVNWFRKDILHGYKGNEDSFFTYAEKNFKDTPSEIFMLPYLGGAATPYQNVNAKAAFLNLTLDTTDADLYQAILEGTSLEMLHNINLIKDYGITVKSAIATGGGANSKAWLQIKADVMGIVLKTLRSSEGGLCGTAIIQAVAMGSAKDYKDALNTFVQYKDTFYPNEDKKVLYDKKYEKYKNLYITLKNFL